MVQKYKQTSPEGKRALLYGAYVFWDVVSGFIYKFDSEREMQDFRRNNG